MVVKMYQDGLSMDEIERQTPYSADRVVIQLRRQGVPIRPASPVNLTDHNLRQAAALRAQGLTYEAIAQRFGVSRQGISQALARHPT
jgi:transposase